MMWQSVLISVSISIVALMLMFFYFRRKLVRLVTETAVLDEVRSEARALITEFNQTSDRNIAVLEDRIRKVKAALAEADRKLLLLNREVNRETVYSALRPAVLQKAKNAASGDNPSDPAARVGQRDSSVPRDLNANFLRNDSREPQRRAESRKADEGAGRKEPVKSETTPDPKDSVLQLYRQGFDVRLIAEKTGVPIGEAELIIALSTRENS